MRKFVLTLALLSPIVCSGENDHSDRAPHHEHGLHSHAQTAPLESGKATLDEHTRSMLQIMKQRAESDAAPKEIGLSLREDVDKLIQNCTTTGEAHDRLHVFLGGLIPRVDELAQDGSQQSLDRVKSELEQYPGISSNPPGGCGRTADARRTGTRTLWRRTRQAPVCAVKSHHRQLF